MNSPQTAGSPLRTRVRVALAAGVGTALEFYDFAIYGTSAALVFGHIFFRTEDAWFATFMSFATFALGFLMAPLGAILFGWVGDRYGRRPSLFLAFTLMGVSTLLMGLLPTYATIGFLAPLLLVLLRLCHGLARGGENAGAAVFAIEHAPEHSRGLYGSFVAIGSPIGLILANFVFALVLMLDDDDVTAWGWRLPFIAGGIVLACGIWVRRGVSETPEFKAAAEDSEAVARPVLPLVDVLKKRWRVVALAAGVNVGLNASTFALATFMLSYATAEPPQGLDLPRQPIVEGTLVALAAHAVVNVLSARLSDRVGRKPVMLLGAALSLASALAMFQISETGTVLAVNLAIFLGFSATGFLFGPMYAFFAELFPRDQRQSGLGFAFHVGAVLGGGISPLIANRIIAGTGESHYVGYYLATLLVLSIVCLLRLPETAPARVSSSSIHNESELANSENRP